MSGAVVWIAAGRMGSGAETADLAAETGDSAAEVVSSAMRQRSVQRSVQREAESAAVAPPGWLATYRAAGDGASVNVHVSDASFAAGVGQSVHPAIEPAQFTVIYSGILNVPEPGRYRFGAEVEGGEVNVSIYGGALRRPVALSIKRDDIDGKMSRWVELGAGEIKVRYVVERSGEKRARMRALGGK